MVPKCHRYNRKLVTDLMYIDKVSSYHVTAVHFTFLLDFLHNLISPSYMYLCFWTINVLINIYSAFCEARRTIDL